MTRARGASRPRFRLLPTVLLTLAILAVPTVVYAWGRSSSSFGITRIQLSGAHLVPAKKSLRLLREAYLGDNLFSVTAEDVRATLEPLSFVAAVRVDRDFPDTLAVKLREYEPAVYGLAGDRWYVLDEEGYVVCTAAAAAEQQAKSATSAKAGDEKAGAASEVHGQASGSRATEAGSGSDATGGAEAAASGSGGSASDQAGEGGGKTARLVAGPQEASLQLPRIALSGQVRQGNVVGDPMSLEMLSVITALPGSYRRRLSAVEDEQGQITLRFADGLVATWGDASRTLAKTVALRTVLNEYADVGKACIQIDVSIPDRTLAKPLLQ